MKRIFNIMLCMTSIVAVSCNKGLEPEGPKMIKVSFEDAETKSSINDTKVLWETGDAMCIYDKTSQNGFIYNVDSGSFDGLITENSTDFYAYYPHLMLSNANNAVLKSETDGNVTFTTFLPSYQKVRKNSVAQGAILSACKPVLNGDKLSGTMQILNSFIKFTVADAENNKIAKIRFKGESGKMMSGRCDVTFSSDGNISVSNAYENYYVECGPEDSKSYIENGTYYVSVLPYNHQGMTITITTTTGDIYEYTYDGWVNFYVKETGDANQVMNLGNIDEGLATGNGLTQQKSILIDFTNTSNITGLENSSNEVQAHITMGNDTYDVMAKGVYLTSYKHAMYPASGYIQTPVIQRKVLTNVVVTCKGESQNNQNKFQLEIGQGPADKNYLTGYYRGTNNVAAGDEAKTNAFPTLGYSGPKLYYSHLFTLGQKSNGEQKRNSYIKPAANTSYYIRNSQGPAQLVYIELIYSPAE